MTTTPVFLADPHKDLTPHSYVIQVSSFKCLNCGTSNRSCEVFSRTWLRGHWGKPFSNLRPMHGDWPRYKLPVEIIHKIPDTVPFCHECPSPQDALKDLPYPPIETPRTPASPAGVQRSSAGVQQSKRKVSTTDDLLKDL